MILINKYSNKVLIVRLGFILNIPFGFETIIKFCDFNVLQKITIWQNMEIFGRYIFGRFYIKYSRIFIKYYKFLSYIIFIRLYQYC